MTLLKLLVLAAFVVIGILLVIILSLFFALRGGKR